MMRAATSLGALLRHNERVVNCLFLETDDFREAQAGQELHIEDLLDRCLEVKHANDLTDS